MCQLCVSLLLFLYYPFIKGQIFLELPPSDVGICFEDTNLICNVSGGVAGSRTWIRPPSAVPIMLNGAEFDTVNKYSESENTNYFTLTIKNLLKTDEGQYKCTNGGDQSLAKTLKYECVQETNVTVLRDDQTKMPQVSMVYIFPNTATVQLVQFILEDGSDISIQGNEGTQDVQANGDHFDLTWNSTVTIPDGTYTCKITMQLISLQIISKSGLAFVSETKGPGLCGLLLCYLLSILSCCLIVPAFIGIHFYLIYNRHTAAVKELIFKDYGIKAFLVGCCICILKVIVQLITYFVPFEGCPVVTCLVVPIVIMVIVNGSGIAIVGVIVHFKKNPDKNGQSAGNEEMKLQKNNTGEESGAACFGGRVIPVCGEPDSQSVNKPRPLPTGADKSHPHVETKTEKGKHEKTGSAVSGGDIQLQQVNKDGDVLKPRKLPDIPGKERETRGLSANFEEDIMDKKRLTPIGQDATEVYEETPRKKKKKKKAKEEEKED